MRPGTLMMSKTGSGSCQPLSDLALEGGNEFGFGLLSRLVISVLNAGGDEAEAVLFFDWPQRPVEPLSELAVNVGPEVVPFKDWVEEGDRPPFGSWFEGG